jgi:hypothetical protein
MDTLFVMEENARPMEEQPETIEPELIDSPASQPAQSPTLSRNEVLFIFLACTLVGFVGVLIGFVPLVAIAMIGPIIAALLA